MRLVQRRARTSHDGMLGERASEGVSARRTAGGVLSLASILPSRQSSVVYVSGGDRGGATRQKRSGFGQFRVTKAITNFLQLQVQLIRTPRRSIPTLEHHCGGVDISTVVSSAHETISRLQGWTNEMKRSYNSSGPPASGPPQPGPYGAATYHAPPQPAQPPPLPAGPPPPPPNGQYSQYPQYGAPAAPAGATQQHQVAQHPQYPGYGYGGQVVSPNIFSKVQVLLEPR